MALLLAATASALFATTEPLTTAAQVRALTPAQAASGLPAKIRGVITFYDPSHYLLFVQDETAGIYVSGGTISARAGDLVEVTGVTSEGGLGHIITGRAKTYASVERLGQGTWPKAIAARPEEFRGTSLDAHWVEVQGEVSSVRIVSGRPMLELSRDGESVRVMLPSVSGRGSAPNYLRGLPVVARGVAGFAGRNSGYLCVPSLREIVPTEEGLQRRFDVGMGRFEDFYGISSEGDGPTLRFFGSVTYAEPGVGFLMLVGKPSPDHPGRLQHWEGHVWVQTSQPGDLAPGAIVDVLGHAERIQAFFTLNDALFRQTSLRWPLSPTPLPSLSHAQTMTNGTFCKLRATLLESSSLGSSRVITVAGDNKLLFVQLPRTLPLGWSLPPEGSTVELQGVIFNEAAPTPRLVDGRNGLQLLLRTVEDFRVISGPPWWTSERVLALVAALVLAAAAATLWGMALRRQVASQLKTIQHQLKRAAVHDERTRIARELHDTIEQHLLCVGMQLDAIGRHLPEAMSQPKRLAEIAREMIGQSREEVREAVWELRRNENDFSSLAQTLKLRLALIAENASRPIVFTAAGIPRPLPGPMERHLLRCALEAVTNALKHARSTRIDVTLEFGEECVRLVVKDDGCGFDSKRLDVADPRHFGLRGLRERAAKINGELVLESHPGIGTEVRIEAPLHSDHLQVTSSPPPFLQPTPHEHTPSPR